MGKKRVPNSISYAIPGHALYVLWSNMLKIFNIYIVGFAMERIFLLRISLFFGNFEGLFYHFLHASTVSNSFPWSIIHKQEEGKEECRLFHSN